MDYFAFSRLHVRFDSLFSAFGHIGSENQLLHAALADGQGLFKFTLKVQQNGMENGAGIGNVWDDE